MEYGGKNSMTSHLKSLGYIHDFDAGYSSEDCWSLIEAEFELTEKGLRNYEYVLKTFFVWIRYIKNMYSSPGVWNIMQKISEYDFYFMKSKPWSSETSKFARNLQLYPFRYIYTSDSVFYKKDDKIVNSILSKLNMDNALIMLSSPSLDNTNDRLYTKFSRTDQYYGTQYSIMTYSDSLKESIENPIIKEGKLYNDKEMDFIDIKFFVIPSYNYYVPNDLDMVCPDRWFIVRVQPNYINECSDEAFKADGDNIVAKLISSDDKGDMWFKQDRSFNVPIVNVILRIETDKGNDNLPQSSKLYFFESLLAEWIVVNLYDALLMSYNFGFDATPNGLQITISGYNDKIQTLIINTLKSFRNLKITQSDFDRVKSKFISDTKAEKLKQPYNLAFKYTKTIINEHGYTYDDILSVSEKLTVDEVQDFHDSFFDEMFVTSLVHGNMASEEAIEIKENIDRILDFGKLGEAFISKPKIHILDGPYAYMYHTFSHDEEDSAIFNSYQAVYIKKEDNEDLKDLLLLDIVSSLISNYAYDYLRTDRLLGYIVSCSAFTIGRSAYLYVVVQGNKESPEIVDNEIENMLRDFRKDELSQLTTEEFDEFRVSMGQQLSTPDLTLMDRTNRIWKEIVDRDKDFKIREKMLKQLEEATVDELLNFYDTKLAPNDLSTVHKLSVQFYSKKNYPELPTELPNSITPYKKYNNINDELVKTHFRR